MNHTITDYDIENYIHDVIGKKFVSGGLKFDCWRYAFDTKVEIKFYKISSKMRFIQYVDVSDILNYIKMQKLNSILE